ncbi:hypothetical protein BH23ACT10_BH23ACT10_06900 [soil metagenome]
MAHPTVHACRHAAETLVDWTPRRSLFLRQPRVIANGLPKAGTNLLVKALTEAAGLRRSRWAIHGRTELPGQPGPTMPVGVDRPRQVAVSGFRSYTRCIAPGTVVSAHLPFSRSAADVLAELGYRVIVIVRDPRDVAISLANYVQSLPNHPLHQRFATAEPAQRLTWTITGVAGELDDLARRIRRVLAWGTWPAALVVRFEDLIGPAGGGDEQTQLTTLSTLAAHAEAPLTRDDAKAAGRRLFGGTRTFRQGQIGGWRTQLNSDHVAQLKQTAGDLLIELGYEIDDDWR